MAYTRADQKLCPANLSLSVLGGKWKLRILHLLGARPFRPGELRRAIGGITEGLLHVQLQELLIDGLIVRTDEGGFPNTVLYSLTPLGVSALPLVEQLRGWGKTYLLQTRGLAVED